MGTTITLTTLPLAETVALTQEIDRLCFPEEMWLTEREWNQLLQGGAETTILKKDNIVIGQSITLPERYVADSLKEVDELFDADRFGIYSYSNAIIPCFQHQGYGSLLILETAIRMRAREFSRMTAHVRTRHGWHTQRKKQLPVSVSRLISDFWTNPLDRMVEYQEVLLQSVTR